MLMKGIADTSCLMIVRIIQANCICVCIFHTGNRLCSCVALSLKFIEPTAACNMSLETSTLKPDKQLSRHARQQPEDDQASKIANTLLASPLPHALCCSWQAHNWSDIKATKKGNDYAVI